MEFPSWQNDQIDESATMYCCGNLESLVAQTSRLRSVDRCSALRLVFCSNYHQHDKESQNRKVAKCIVDLLRANPSIKSLVIEKFARHSIQCGVWMSVFEALATDEAESHVESIDVGSPSLYDGECAVLARYFARSQKLQHLRVCSLTCNSPYVYALIHKNGTSLFLEYRGQAGTSGQPLGSMLQQCPSISTLSVYASTVPDTFFSEGIGKMRRLKHFAITITRITPSLIDLIASFAVQHTTLVSVSITTSFEAKMSDHWTALSSSLKYVKNVSFTSRYWSEDSHCLAVAIQGLTHVETLKVEYTFRIPKQAECRLLFSIASRLLNLKSIKVRLGPAANYVDTGSAETAFLEIAKTRNTVTDAKLEIESRSLSHAFRAQVSYYCF